MSTMARSETRSRTIPAPMKPAPPRMVMFMCRRPFRILARGPVSESCPLIRRFAPPFPAERISDMLAPAGLVKPVVRIGIPPALPTGLWSMITIFERRKASSPRRPSSRPMPELFQPPKGRASLSIIGLLTQTMPLSSRSAASIASSSEVVKTEAPRPNGLSLARRDRFVEIRDPDDRRRPVRNIPPA